MIAVKEFGGGMVLLLMLVVEEEVVVAVEEEARPPIRVLRFEENNTPSRCYQPIEEIISFPLI